MEQKSARVKQSKKSDSSVKDSFPAEQYYGASVAEKLITEVLDRNKHSHRLHNCSCLCHKHCLRLIIDHIDLDSRAIPVTTHYLRAAKLFIFLSKSILLLPIA